MPYLQEVCTFYKAHNELNQYVANSIEQTLP
jgi:hypothetical protein